MVIDSSPITIKVTFHDHVPIRLVDGMVETDWTGLCKTYRGDHARALLLRPSAEQYPDVKFSLEELRSEGALTFVVESAELG